MPDVADAILSLHGWVVLLVVLVVLELSPVLDVEELVDLHPITHATNNAKASAVL